MHLNSSSPPGRPVQNNPPVPVHWLARARSAKNWRGLHWFHRTSSQNQGAVWTRRTNLCTLQVRRLTFILKLKHSRQTRWMEATPVLCTGSHVFLLQQSSLKITKQHHWCKVLWDKEHPAILIYTYRVFSNKNRYYNPLFESTLRFNSCLLSIKS